MIRCSHSALSSPHCSGTNYSNPKCNQLIFNFTYKKCTTDKCLTKCSICSILSFTRFVDIYMFFFLFYYKLWLLPFNQNKGFPQHKENNKKKFSLILHINLPLHNLGIENIELLNILQMKELTKLKWKKLSVSYSQEVFYQIYNQYFTFYSV